MSPPLPHGEPERLRALDRYAILDTPAEPLFDHFTALAADLFQVPIALLSLVDAERQWFKSAFGFEEVHETAIRTLTTPMAPRPSSQSALSSRRATLVRPGGEGGIVEAKDADGKNPGVPGVPAFLFAGPGAKGQGAKQRQRHPDGGGGSRAKCAGAE